MKKNKFGKLVSKKASAVASRKSNLKGYLVGKTRKAPARKAPSKPVRKAPRKAKRKPKKRKRYEDDDEDWVPGSG